MNSTVWKRQHWVTKGADPTEVVEWFNTETKMSITEFQNVYTVTVNGLEMRTDPFWQRMHCNLEGQWQADQAERETLRDMYEGMTTIGWSDPEVRQ